MMAGWCLMKSKPPYIFKVGLRKPILGARILHITINNRAWQKEALAKPITRGSKNND